MVWIIVLVVVLIIGFLIARAYNSLVAKRNRVDTSWSHVEVQLQRRYDLIPNLVETVKGYATHESGTFERVVAARAAGQSASGPAEQTQADNLLTGALRQLFAVAEDYRHSGVGSQMIAKLTGKLSSQRRSRIVLEVRLYADVFDQALFLEASEGIECAFGLAGREVIGIQHFPHVIEIDGIEIEPF